MAFDRLILKCSARWLGEGKGASWLVAFSEDDRLEDQEQSGMINDLDSY